MIGAIQKAGNAKNTQNQAINAINDPKIGDSTFPKPFEASTRPSTRLSSAPLKRSPVSAIAIGAVPAAPSPCSPLPNSTHGKAFAKVVDANPARIPLPHKGTGTE